MQSGHEQILLNKQRSVHLGCPGLWLGGVLVAYLFLASSCLSILEKQRENTVGTILEQAIRRIAWSSGDMSPHVWYWEKSYKHTRTVYVQFSSPFSSFPLSLLSSVPLPPSSTSPSSTSHSSPSHSLPPFLTSLSSPTVSPPLPPPPPLLPHTSLAAVSAFLFAFSASFCCFLIAFFERGLPSALHHRK